MLRILRHLKKSLIEQKKIRTYALYALGEVLLVVIGILLALQIGAWNQQRIEKNLEENYLLLLKEELQTNIDFIQSFYLDRYERKVEVLEMVRDFYQGQYEIVDSVAFATQMGYGAVFSTQAIGTETIVFDEMISTGNLNVISSEELRRSLISYYGNLEGLRQGLSYYRSGYMTAVNSLRPFKGSDPDNIETFDVSLSIREAGTAEFYKMANAELTYAHQAINFMTLLKDSAENIIIQIDETLEGL